MATTTLGLLALTGCADSTDYSDYNFKSGDELIEVLEQRLGYTCIDSIASDEAELIASMSERGFDLATCMEVGAVIWASDAKRLEIDLGLTSGTARLDGGNWTLQGDQYVIEDAQEELGGILTQG